MNRIIARAIPPLCAIAILVIFAVTASAIGDPVGWLR